MSINHYLDDNIVPKLDAYAKDVYVDTLNIDELVVNTADVKFETTFGSAEDIFGNNKITDLSGLELVNLDIGDTIITEKLESETLKVNQNFTSLSINAITTDPLKKTGVSNPDTINIQGISNIVNTYISGTSTDYTNCEFNLIPSPTYTWLYEQSRIERTVLVGSDVLQIRRIRLNINMKSRPTQDPQNQRYFAFSLIDSDVTPSNTILVTCMGLCSELGTTSSLQGKAFMTGVGGTPFNNTEVTNGKIIVKYGDFVIYPADVNLNFTLDLEYIVN